MSETPNFYAIIPATVRYDKNITDKAKILYAEISALANAKGYCYASNAYFSNLYSVDSCTVSRIISSLVLNEYINIVDGKNQKRRIYISDNALTKISNRLDENIKPSLDKNVKHNNTSINNINNIYTHEFENWYSSYPNPKNKQQTFRNFKNVLKKISIDELIRATDNYKSYIKTAQIDAAYIVRSSNFVGQKAEYEEWLKQTPQPQMQEDTETADIIRKRKEALGL